MTNEAPTAGKTLQQTIWSDAKPYLAEACNISLGAAGAIIGRWMGEFDHADIRHALSRAMNMNPQPQDPRGYIRAILKRLKRERAPEPAELDDRRLLDKISHMRRFCETRAVSQHAHKLLGELEGVAREKGLL